MEPGDPNTDKFIAEMSAVLKEPNSRMAMQAFITRHAALLDVSLKIARPAQLFELVYPESTMEPYRFAHVIGIIQLVQVKDGRRVIILGDETESSGIVVQLGNCLLWRAKSLANQMNGNKVLFSDVHAAEYHSLQIGAIVLIRNLCLGHGRVHICVNPQQTLVLQPFASDPDAQPPLNFKISKLEFAHLLNLTGYLSCSLMRPTPRSNENHLNIHMAVLLLSKQYISRPETHPFMQIFVLLPSRNQYPTFISPDINNAQFIYKQMTSTALSPNQELFSEEIIQQLINMNQVVLLKMYPDKKATSLGDIIPIDVVTFFNVHLKPDLKYPSHYQFILHNNSSWRCSVVDDESILGTDSQLESAKHSLHLPFPCFNSRSGDAVWFKIKSLLRKIEKSSASNAGPGITSTHPLYAD